MKSNHTYSNLRSCGVAVAGILLIAATVARADDPAPEAKKGWETSAAAGLTITRGTHDTMLVTAGLNTSRKWDKDEAAFGISGGYGEDKNNSVLNSQNVVNNNFVQGFGQYNRLFTEKFYGGLRLDAAYDGIAKLDYRVTLTPWPATTSSRTQTPPWRWKSVPRWSRRSIPARPRTPTSGSASPSALNIS